MSIRGFGFVSFLELSGTYLNWLTVINILAMEAAVADLHTIDGRTVDVKKAIPRDRPVVESSK